MKNLNRKILIICSLISIIPLLVFAYLVLPYFTPIAAPAIPVPSLVLITIVILLLGVALLLRLNKNINKLSASADIIAKGDLTHSVGIRDDGEIVGLANSLNQITQRLRQDMNDLESRAILVERANRELSRLNKLKSEFVTMVSHELRAPLINIKQAVSLVSNKLAGRVYGEEERCLAIADRNAERLLKLINDLLDISKIEAGEFKLNREKIYIGKNIGEAAESVERWRETKKIELKLEINPELPDAYADPDRVNQILVNLLSNAIKFTPAGGRITVKAEAQKQEDFLRISVIDTGIGIPSNELDRVFGSFKQAGSSSSQTLGTGLGLSITREIVRMHGGRIWTESKRGEGSKFTFSLPKYNPLQRLKKNIMIVDDEPGAVDVLKALLQRFGYTNLTEASDGDEALRRLNESSPDLLILDMNLPKLSGYEIIGMLRENSRTKEMPILIVSGYSVDTDRLKKYSEDRAIPVLEKPVNIGRLKTLVDNLL